MPTALVTGATSGVGLALAERLAAAGWRLILHGRRPDRLDRAARRIRHRTGVDGACVEADLSDLSAVRRLAATVTGGIDRLDVLVHNAGVIRPLFERAAGGVEATMTVNALAPFVLTERLRPLLTETAARHGEARVVTVSSEAHGGSLGEPDAGLADRLRTPLPPERYEPVRAYALSKRVLTTWALELGRQLAGSGVTSNACHPGLVRTAVFGGMGETKRLVATALSPLFLPPRAGAESAFWLATDPAWRGRTGRWVTRSHTARPHEAPPPAETADPAWGAAMWEALAQIAEPVVAA